MMGNKNGRNGKNKNKNNENVSVAGNIYDTKN